MRTMAIADRNGVDPINHDDVCVHSRITSVEVGAELLAWPPIAERGAEAPRRLPYATFSLSRNNNQMPSRTEIVELSLRHIHRPDQP